MEAQTMQEALDQYVTISLRRGEIRTGVITGMNNYGYSVDIGFRVEGFLPMREYTNHSLVETAEPKIGDRIEVEVTGVRDGEEAQLFLSRWRNEFDKRWANLEAKIAENPVINVMGLAQVKGGLEVECCGLEGFIPLSHLTLSGGGANPADFVGTVMQVKVLDHDKRKHRLVFSRREVLRDERKKDEAYAREVLEVMQFIQEKNAECEEIIMKIIYKREIINLLLDQLK